MKELYFDSIQSVTIAYDIAQDKLQQKIFQEQKFITKTVLTKKDSITNHYRMLEYANECKMKYINDSVDKHYETELFLVRERERYNHERIWYDHTHKTEEIKLKTEINRKKKERAEELYIREKYKNIEFREKMNQLNDNEKAKIKTRKQERETKIMDADEIRAHAEMLIKKAEQDKYTHLMSLTKILINESILSPNDSTYLVDLSDKILN